MTSSVMGNPTIVLAMSFWVDRGLVPSGSNWVDSRYTEIGLLVDQGHTQLPVLDTTALHAQGMVNFALNT